MAVFVFVAGLTSMSESNFLPFIVVEHIFRNFSFPATNQVENEVDAWDGKFCFLYSFRYLVCGPFPVRPCFIPSPKLGDAPAEQIL